MPCSNLSALWASLLIWGENGKEEIYHKGNSRQFHLRKIASPSFSNTPSSVSDYRDTFSLKEKEKMKNFILSAAAISPWRHIFLAIRKFRLFAFIPLLNRSNVTNHTRINFCLLKISQNAVFLVTSFAFIVNLAPNFIWHVFLIAFNGFAAIMAGVFFHVFYYSLTS